MSEDDKHRRWRFPVDGYFVLLWRFNVPAQRSWLSDVNQTGAGREIRSARGSLPRSLAGAWRYVVTCTITAPVGSREARRMVFYTLAVEPPAVGGLNCWCAGQRAVADGQTFQIWLSGLALLRSPRRSSRMVWQLVSRGIDRGGRPGRSLECFSLKPIPTENCR